MIYEHDVKVLNKLNVTIRCNVCVAEPDVGMMGDYIDDWHIVAVEGKKRSNLIRLIHDRIEQTYGEEERICSEILSSLINDVCFDEEF